MRTENAIRTSTVLVMNTLQESVAILETASGQCRLGDTLFFARTRHSEEKARRDVREDYGVEEPNAPGEPGRDPQRYCRKHGEFCRSQAGLREEPIRREALDDERDKPPTRS